MAKRTRLNQQEINQLVYLSDRIDKLRQKFSEEDGTDIELRIKDNGTVGGNLSCAMASIDVILQEYL